MREADDDAIRRARVYVDTRAGALKEAGDIVDPLDDGRHQRRATSQGDLFELCRGKVKGRTTRRTRSRCSSRSAPRSRIWPRRCWSGDGLRPEGRQCRAGRARTRRRHATLGQNLRAEDRPRPSTPRSMRAPTWSASCSFRRRRAMSSFDAARALGARVKGRARKVALTVDADDATFAAIVAALQARPASASRQGDAGARFGALQAALRPAGDEGARRSRPQPISQPSRPMHASPTGCCSTRARRARPPGRAGSASRSTGHLLKALDPALPFMLSGGLDAGNVGRGAARSRGRPAVDVSSGVESAPGRKGPVERSAPSCARRAQAEARSPRSRLRAAHEHPAAQFLPHRARRATGISASMADASSPRR